MKAAATVALLALCGLAAWGGCGLTKHAIVAIDRLGDAAAGMSEATAKVSGKHGTIAMADEDIGAVKSLIVHADLVTRHEQQSLTGMDARGVELFNNVNGAISDGRKTERAATTAVASIGKTADSATIALNGVPPTLEAYQRAGQDFDALLTRPAIGSTLDSAARITANADGIVADGRKVADKATADYVMPKPWYVKARQYMGDGLDIAAFFAR